MEETKEYIAGRKQRIHKRRKTKNTQLEEIIGCTNNGNQDNTTSTLEETKDYTTKTSKI